MDRWFERIASAELDDGEAMDVDYQLYGEGEALLGWLNATLHFDSAEPVEGDAVLLNLARDIQSVLADGGIEIAHLKMTLSPAGGSQEIASINLVANDVLPEATLTLSEPVHRGEVVVNLRAEGSPAALEMAVERATTSSGEGIPVWRREHLECFKPGQPTPVFRESGLDSAT